MVVKENEGKELKEKEVKVEVCLVEEGKGREEEELTLPVWEEDIKDQGGRGVFNIPRAIKTDEGRERKGKEQEFRYVRMHRLLEDILKSRRIITRSGSKRKEGDCN